MDPVTPTGMDAIITALAAGFTADKVFAIVASLVPFILAIIPISLGLMFLRKLVKGSAKGKVKF